MLVVGVHVCLSECIGLLDQQIYVILDHYIIQDAVIIPVYIPLLQSAAVGGARAGGAYQGFAK